MTKEEKIQALFEDKEAIKEIFVEDVDQTLANLAAHGIEMSEEELGELTAGLVEGMGISDDELSEDALEDVAGGGIGKSILKKCLKDVANAVSGGFTRGRADKQNKSASGIAYVESAKTPIGKGWRGIGYTIGYYL